MRDLPRRRACPLLPPPPSLVRPDGSLSLQTPRPFMPPAATWLRVRIVLTFVAWGLIWPAAFLAGVYVVTSA